MRRSVTITRQMASFLNAGRSHVDTTPWMLNYLVQAVYGRRTRRFESERIIHTLELRARHITIVHAEPTKSEKLVKRGDANRPTLLSDRVRQLIGVAVRCIVMC